MGIGDDIRRTLASFRDAGRADLEVKDGHIAVHEFVALDDVFENDG